MLRRPGGRLRGSMRPGRPAASLPLLYCRAAASMRLDLMCNGPKNIRKDQEKDLTFQSQYSTI